MKTNKSRLFTLIALGGLMAVGPIVRADDTPAQTPPPPAPDATAPAAGHAKGHEQMDKLFAAIKATDSEKEKLKPIFKDRNNQLKAMREDASLSQADKKAKRKEIMQGVNAKVKEVLTADQYADYETFMKDQAKHAKGAEQPAALPTDTAPKN